MSNEFIFVYGILRKEAATSMYYALARYCDYFCDGYMRGKLYEVDGYPGAVESGCPGDMVFGELHRINVPEKLMPILDDYEECANSYPQPHEYVRKKILISIADGRDIFAWVYIYNHDVSKLKRISSGDYLKKSSILQERIL